MKNQTSISSTIGIALLFTGAVFSYSDSESMVTGAGESSSLSHKVDCAPLVIIVMCVALIVVGRRISQVRKIAIHGRSPKGPLIPLAWCVVILVAIPFLLIGGGEVIVGDSFRKSYSYGKSPLKLPAFLLALYFTWRVALLRQLRATANSPAPLHFDPTKEDVGNGTVSHLGKGSSRKT